MPWAPFEQLRFRIWQRFGFDPRLRVGWFFKATKRLLVWLFKTTTPLLVWLFKATKRVFVWLFKKSLLVSWDVVALMVAACGLGWYSNTEPEFASKILLPIALLAIALLVVGSLRRDS